MGADRLSEISIKKLKFEQKGTQRFVNSFATPVVSSMSLKLCDLVDWWFSCQRMWEVRDTCDRKCMTSSQLPKSSNI